MRDKIKADLGTKITIDLTPDELLACKSSIKLFLLLYEKVPQETEAQKLLQKTFAHIQGTMDRYDVQPDVIALVGRLVSQEIVFSGEMHIKGEETQ